MQLLWLLRLAGWWWFQYCMSLNVVLAGAAATAVSAVDVG
jgi:hypothetical protein